MGRDRQEGRQDNERGLRRQISENEEEREARLQDEFEPPRSEIAKPPIKKQKTIIAQSYEEKIQQERAEKDSSHSK